MKIFLLALGIFFTLQATAFNLTTITMPQGHLTKHVQDILITLGESPRLTPSQAEQLLEEKFGRKGTQERQTLTRKERVETNKEHLWPLFRKLGMIDAVPPSDEHFDYVVILGSTLENMRNRLRFLNLLISSQSLNISSKTKFFIAAGNRALFPHEDPLNSPLPFRKGWERTYPLPKTEGEGGDWVVNQVVESPDIRNRFKTLIAPKRFEEEEKKWVRPHTGNTITVLLREVGNNLKGKRFLFISSNPYVFYQYAIIAREFMDNGLSPSMVEVVGKESSSNISGTLLLDNVRNTIKREIEVYEREVAPR